MPWVVLMNDSRSAEMIGYPITSSSTSSDGDSSSAARLATPARRPTGRPGLVSLVVGTSTEVVVVTGGPPCTGVPGRGITPARRALLLADDRRQLGLHALQRVVHRLRAGQRRVDVLLDRGRGVAVLDHARPGDRVVHRLLEDGQVRELLEQLGVVIQAGVHRRLGGLLQVQLLLRLAGQELDERQRAALVLGELADRQVVAAEAGLADAVETGQRADGELAGDLAGAVRGAGQLVLVRPLPVEDQLAVLERAAAFLFLVG